MITTILEIAAGAAAAMLLVSGFLKLRGPDPAIAACRTVAASREAFAQRCPRWVKVVSFVEVGVGATALVVRHPLPWILAAAVFCGLTLVLLRLHRLSPAAPCGCYGELDPFSYGPHTVINVLASGACVAAAVLAARPPT